MTAPWHFLYFWPLPHGQGSFRPTRISEAFSILVPPSRIVSCMGERRIDAFALRARSRRGLVRRRPAGSAVCDLSAHPRSARGKDLRPLRRALPDAPRRCDHGALALGPCALLVASHPFLLRGPHGPRTHLLPRLGAQPRRLARRRGSNEELRHFLARQLDRSLH